MSDPLHTRKRLPTALGAALLLCAFFPARAVVGDGGTNPPGAGGNPPGAGGNPPSAGTNPASAGGNPSSAAAADAGSKQALVIEESDVKAGPPPPFPVGDELKAIGEYIKNHSEAVTDCYADRVRLEPTLQGKLVARFQIGPTGRVIGAMAEGVVDPKRGLPKITDRELLACVAAAVRKWEFDKPASGGKLSVVYPYVFRPIASP